jgi:chromosome segregation ATPase
MKWQGDILQSQTNAVAGLKGQLDAAQATLTRRQSDLVKVTSGIVDAQKQFDDRQRQIADKFATIAALDAQKATIETQIPKLKADRDQLVQDTAGKDVLAQQWRDLNSQIGKASAKLELKNKALAAAMAAEADYENKVNRREALDAQIAELSKSKDTLAAEVAKLQAQWSILRQNFNSPQLLGLPASKPAPPKKVPEN